MDIRKLATCSLGVSNIFANLVSINGHGKSRMLDIRRSVTLANDLGNDMFHLPAKFGTWNIHENFSIVLYIWVIIFSIQNRSVKPF